MNNFIHNIQTNFKLDESQLENKYKRAQTPMENIRKPLNSKDSNTQIYDVEKDNLIEDLNNEI
jgi:hypothetical protein